MRTQSASGMPVPISRTTSFGTSHGSLCLGQRSRGSQTIIPRSRNVCTALHSFAKLFEGVGNYVEHKRLLIHGLKLERERGNDYQVAQILMDLSDANRLMGLYEEGIHQGEETLEIFERLGETVGQAECLNYLAWLFYEDEQLEAAEEAASHAINLIPEKDHQFQVCGSHRVLGNVYRSKGEREKAISHFEAALRIASSLGWHNQLFWAHFGLALLFSDEDEFGDAYAHVERAKSHAVDNTYHVGRAMELQAGLCHKHHRLEESRSEASRAADIFENLGAVKGMERCRELLRWIVEGIDNPVASGQLDPKCEFLQMVFTS